MDRNSPHRITSALKSFGLVPWPLPSSLAIPLTHPLLSRIFLKLENLQPSGSFKSRGIGNLVLHYANEYKNSGKRVHFYSSSGGNAGLACVTAAVSLGYPASVVVPETTKPMMIAKLRAAGATEVVQHGASWKEADTYLREEILAKLNAGGEIEGVHIPPFDHPRIWEGVASMVEEVQRQLPQDGADGDETPDAVICSVGGGGLFCGVCEGLDRVGWGDVQVLAMETVGAESLAKSLEAGELVTLPGITSIATSLGAVRVAEQTFHNGQRKNVQSVVLRDEEAAMGSWRLADDERVLVDPACGVSVALCYGGRLKGLVPGLRKDSKVVVVVCGGSQVTVEMVAQWRETYGGLVKGDENRDTEDVPSSHTVPA